MLWKRLLKPSSADVISAWMMSCPSTQSRCANVRWNLDTQSGSVSGNVKL